LQGEANFKRQQKSLDFLIIVFRKSLSVKSNWQTTELAANCGFTMLNIQMLLKKKNCG
jgi:hypothetical protein